MTVAEDAVKSQRKYVIGLLIACFLLAFAMIITGYCLTQQQIGARQGTGQTELELKQTELKLKSTYPGIAFITCGTLIMLGLLNRRVKFKTQHKDEKNNVPGFTEIEY